MKNIKKIVSLIVVILLLFTSYLITDKKHDTTTTSTSVQNTSTSKILSTWGRSDSLQDHFNRHGADFKATSTIDYAEKAHELYLNRSKYEVKTDSSNIRVYDPKTNSFGAYNTNGTTKSFFKPSNGQKYFDGQPGH